MPNTHTLKDRFFVYAVVVASLGRGMLAIKLLLYEYYYCYYYYYYY